MSSVAAGDGNPEPSKGLAHYYASTGTPPGVFLGKGLADLDDGRGVVPGSQVSEENLSNMLGACSDPVSGEPVGSRPRAPAGGAPVAGFDLTFSISKSISVMWALGDDETRNVIEKCHREAIEFVISYAEREVFCSRSGTNGIVSEDVTGVIAASFTHFTSRADDCQLHDHVVVWNRARSVSDGKWRTLDSKAIFKATTTLSELHQGVLSDLLTAELGVGWEARGRRHSSKPRYEITGVPEALMAEFSQRSEQIAARGDELNSSFVDAHGRRPTVVETMRLRQVATIATRPQKTHRSLAELTSTWRERAAGHVPEDEQLAWVSSLAGRNDLPLLRADDLAEPILDDAAQAVVTTVAEHHSTYGRQNLLAEAHRVLHGVRFATPDDRVAVAEHITDLAVARSVVLTPPAMHHTPERYIRPDGSSRLLPRNHLVYTTEVLLEKTHRSLTELTSNWRERAAGHVPEEEQLAWVSSLAGRNDLPLLRAGDLAEPILNDAAQAVVTTVAEHHSTYGRQNLLAEAHRLLHGVRFASPDDRVAVAEHITDLAVARSVVLTPPAMHHTPERYIRPDGSSRLQPRNHLVYTTDVYTTEVLLEAEDRLLEAGREHGAVRVSTATVANIAEANLPGRDYGLSARPGPRRGEDRHLRACPRRARRSGRQREVDHHGGPQGRLGGRARARVGDRSRPLCCCGTGARRRARDRDREHRQVAHRVATHPGAEITPGPVRIEPRPQRISAALPPRPSSAPGSRRWTRPSPKGASRRDSWSSSMKRAWLGPSPSTSSWVPRDRPVRRSCL